MFTTCLLGRKLIEDNICLDGPHRQKQNTNREHFTLEEAWQLVYFGGSLAACLLWRKLGSLFTLEEAWQFVYFGGSLAICLLWRKLGNLFTLEEATVVDNLVTLEAATVLAIFFL